MKKTLVTCALAALVVLVATPVSAENFNLFARLTGGEENPAILTGAVGTAEVSIDPATRVISVTLRLFNFPTGTTAGHIHAGPRGVNGPIILDFPVPIGVTGDILSLTFTLTSAQLRPQPAVGINTMDDAIQTIVGGGAYANVHTSANPGGEIRGQLGLQ